MNPSILLLTREGIVNNRAVINDLWCDIIPKKGVRIFWIPGNNIITNRTVLKGKNICILISNRGIERNLFFKTFISLIHKLKTSLFLVRNKLVNQAQVRNGIGDGLICLFLKLIYGLPYSFHLSSLHGFEDKSLLSSQHAFQKIKFNFRVVIYPILYRIILRHASIVQPISISMGEYLSHNVKIDEKKIYPLPISSSRKKMMMTKSRQLSKAPKIVYAGTLGAERDIEFLFKVFGSVAKLNPSVTFRIIGIVGKNTHLESLENWQIQNGIERQTEFFLNVPYSKVWNLISECDIGVSPIKPNEKYKVSTPTKTIEYLSCGLPVVCNNEIYDQEYVISHSNGGFSVPYSVKHFANAIVSILKDNVNFFTFENLYIFY